MLRQIRHHGGPCHSDATRKTSSSFCSPRKLWCFGIEMRPRYAKPAPSFDGLLSATRHFLWTTFDQWRFSKAKRGQSPFSENQCRDLCLATPASRPAEGRCWCSTDSSSERGSLPAEARPDGLQPSCQLNFRPCRQPHHPHLQHVPTTLSTLRAQYQNRAPLDDFSYWTRCSRTLAGTTRPALLRSSADPILDLCKTNRAAEAALLLSSFSACSLGTISAAPSDSPPTSCPCWRLPRTR
jgi:hypothetical protein